MRDPFRAARPPSSRAIILAVILVLCAVAFVTLDRLGRLDTLRNNAEVIIAPALGGLTQARDQASGVIAQSEAAQLRERVQQLESENSRLKSENIRALALAQENEQLRRQVRLEQDRPWKLTSAPVLTYAPEAGRHLLRIATGSDAGVRRGMAVVAQEGDSPLALIGVVDDVSANSATVLLIADFTSAISADIYHQGKPVSGVLQGQWERNALLRIDDVERATLLAAGDVVMTAGLSARLAPGLPGAEIPRNVPIGVIDNPRTSGNSQSADVRPFIDPARVRSAWVILSAEG